MLSAAALLVMLGAKTANSRAQGLAEATSPNIAMQSDCVSFSGYRHRRQRTVKTVKGPSKNMYS